MARKSVRWSWRTRFLARKSTSTCCTRLHAGTCADCVQARTRSKKRAKSAERDASSGSRRARAARVWVRSGRLCGAMAAPNVLQPYDVLKHDLLVLSKDEVTRLSHSLDPEKKPVVVPDVETIAPAAKPGKKDAAPKAAAKKPAAAKKAAKPVKKKGKG